VDWEGPFFHFVRFNVFGFMHLYAVSFINCCISVVRGTVAALNTVWHTGTTPTTMILKDEAVTMARRAEVGFKRINSLAHYRVLDGAVMSLIPSQTSASCYDLSAVTDRSSFQQRYGQSLLLRDASC